MKSSWIIALLLGTNLATLIITATVIRSATISTSTQESSPNSSQSRQTQACCPCLNTITPTFAPSPKPSTKPTAKGIWIPPPGTSWQWQISGQVDTSFNVAMYDIDLFDTPQTVIDKLKSDGRIVICYFSAGSYENWRPDQKMFPASTLGSPLDGWPGERWLDIRRMDFLGPIMKARLDLAVNKRCDGVEPDNIDGYQNANGLSLTGDDQLTYNKWLASEAHARGLSIGLKNDLNQIPQLLSHFDWAINEQCSFFNECQLLLPFINAGKAVFGVEYSGNASKFCPKLNAIKFSWLKKNLMLDAWRVDCKIYK